MVQCVPGEVRTLAYRLMAHIHLYCRCTLACVCGPFIHSSIAIPHLPVPREDQPWRLGPVHRLKMADKEGVLLRAVAKVVFCAHHHNMDTTKVKTIPAWPHGHRHTSCHYYIALWPWIETSEKRTALDNLYSISHSD